MKSEELFGKRVSSKDGLRSYCNECRRLESKLYRQNNKDKRRETVRKYNLKNKDILNYPRTKDSWDSETLFRILDVSPIVPTEVGLILSSRL
jgi:phenylalanine-4-hydroxylase